LFSETIPCIDSSFIEDLLNKDTEVKLDDHEQILEEISFLKKQIKNISEALNEKY
jgi:cell division septum initiation protein DivIVA